MADQTLASLTAATPATGGLLYGTQGGADRKFTLSAAGAALMEAADALKLDELAAPTDVTTLNATTSAHGLLPKLGGGTTNFLRADGAWATPPGGGEVNFTHQAWVDAVTGDNGTAVVGKPSRPFVTLQAAYDAGALTIHVSSGVSFGDLTIEGNRPLSLIGIGKSQTVLSNIYANNVFAGYLDLRGNGRDSITISGNVYLTAYAGANGGQGGDFIAANISGFNIGGNVALKGGPGGSGLPGEDATEGGPGNPAQAGGRGGNAPIVYLTDCDVAGYVTSTPGNGGVGGQGGSSIDTNGGNGGDGGLAGAAGSIVVLRCSIQGFVDSPAASGGAGGAAGGGPFPGALAGTDQPPGSVGTVSSEWATIANPSTTSTSSYRAALVGGIWYP